MDKLLDATMNFLYRNEENMDEEQAEIVRYGLELFYLKAFFFSCNYSHRHTDGKLLGEPYFHCFVIRYQNYGRRFSCKYKNAMLYNVHAYICMCTYDS